MICFRDTTFCSSPDCVNACGRQLTREDRDEARRWWGSDDPPIAFARFCDEPAEPENDDAD